MYSILVLGRGNSARSHIAEAIIRFMSNDTVQVCSAGVVVGKLDSRAVDVMREIGIDISGYSVNTIDDYAGRYFDVVLTVCDSVREQSPSFPGQFSYVSWSVADPSLATGSDEEIREQYRVIRNELIERVRTDLAWRIGNEHWRTTLPGENATP